MEAFAERLRDAVAFGAYIDGEIIGLSVFKQEDGPKDAHKAHLSGVFVEPEQRGRGVAGMLLRAVIDYGREHVEQIMLTVYKPLSAIGSLPCAAPKPATQRRQAEQVEGSACNPCPPVPRCYRSRIDRREEEGSDDRGQAGERRQ